MPSCWVSPSFIAGNTITCGVRSVFFAPSSSANSFCCYSIQKPPLWDCSPSPVGKVIPSVQLLKLRFRGVVSPLLMPAASPYFKALRNTSPPSRACDLQRGYQLIPFTVGCWWVLLFSLTPLRQITSLRFVQSCMLAGVRGEFCPLRYHQSSHLILIYLKLPAVCKSGSKKLY